MRLACARTIIASAHRTPFRVDHSFRYMGWLLTMIDPPSYHHCLHGIYPCVSIIVRTLFVSLRAVLYGCRALLVRRVGITILSACSAHISDFTQKKYILAPATSLAWPNPARSSILGDIPLHAARGNSSLRTYRPCLCYDPSRLLEWVVGCFTAVCTVA